MEDLSHITIECNCVPGHDWMSFASWYSLSKRLPDSEVSIRCRFCHLFGWARRLGVKVSGVSSGFKIPPTVMAVRDFEGDISISSSKIDTQTCLVDYSEGCGNFVVEEWLNRPRVPFFGALRRFGAGGMTVNEFAVLGVWEQCHNLYLHAGG